MLAESTNYAIGDTESEDSDPEDEHTSEPESESENTPSPEPQTSSSQPSPKNDDYNPFKGQIAEIDSMLAGPSSICEKFSKVPSPKQAEDALHNS
ncbi:2509_t:CDS:2, partial [Funneliformis mosseae]